MISILVYSNICWIQHAPELHLDGSVGSHFGTAETDKDQLQREWYIYVPGGASLKGLVGSSDLFLHSSDILFV
jgi:hypothetical protein